MSPLSRLRSIACFSLALGLSLAGGNAIAAPGESNDDYFGMAMNWTDISIEDVETTSTRLFGFRYGKMLTERFGVEGRFNLGIGAYTVDDCAYDNGQLVCQSQNIRIRNTYGVLGRAYLFTDGTFRPYGALGFTRANIEVNIDGTDYNYSDGSASYGIGVDIGVDTLAFNIEYMSLLDANGTSLEGFSLGFTSRF